MEGKRSTDHVMTDCLAHEYEASLINLYLKIKNVPKHFLRGWCCEF